MMNLKMVIEAQKVQLMQQQMQYIQGMQNQVAGIEHLDISEEDSAEGWGRLCEAQAAHAVRLGRDSRARKPVSNFNLPCFVP